MAIKKTWNLHVTFLLLSTIEGYDGRRDEVIDRLMSTFGGTSTGGAFEPVSLRCDCDNDVQEPRTAPFNIAGPHEVQGRVLDFEFEDVNDALAAADLLQDIGPVVGTYVNWSTVDDQYPEDDDRRYGFAEEAKFLWTRHPPQDPAQEGDKVIKEKGLN